MVWHRAGHRNREIAVCTLIAGHHTVEDIPTLVARRRGIRTSAVVLDSLTPPTKPRIAAPAVTQLGDHSEGEDL